MDISVIDKKQLLHRLRNIDISVPPRGPDRTNDHVERWSMARVLATLAESGDLAYPLITKKHERPDYVISQQTQLTGFEITEAINPQYVQAESLPKAIGERSIVDAGHFKWGKKHNLSDLKNIASRTKLTSLPWMGNDVEEEYAQMVKDIISKKTKKLLKPGFARYVQNNLIIYSNQMLPFLESCEAGRLCHESLHDYWGSDSFDNVYVEHFSEIHHYNRSAVRILPLNDLWRGN